MIAGMEEAVVPRLRALLDDSVTEFPLERLAGVPVQLYDGHGDECRGLGLDHAAGPELTVAATRLDRRLGALRIETSGANNFLFFDNAAWSGELYGNIRILGSDCAILFCDIGARYVALHDVLLRSNRQFLFWGAESSAVGCSIEIEGTGQGVVVGDDAMAANGVWIRNHDMHALHDLRTGAPIGRPPVDTVLERHVWLGQEALLLSCERVGRGSVIGARALVKGVVGPRRAVAGIPARTIREEVSWGRDVSGMTDAERRTIGPQTSPTACC